MTSDRCWHLRAHRRPCDAGSRPIIIIRSIVIIGVSTIMIVAAISSSPINVETSRLHQQFSVGETWFRQSLLLVCPSERSRWCGYEGTSFTALIDAHGGVDQFVLESRDWFQLAERAFPLPDSYLSASELRWAAERFKVNPGQTHKCRHCQSST